MNTIEIKEHYENFQEWLQSLKSVDDQVWFAPIAEGKWSISAIISHLLFWDRHSLNHFLPAFKQDAILEGFPDIQQVNDAAREYAHNGITKEQLINEIIAERQSYFHFIEKFGEENLQQSFFIGKHPMSVEEFFIDFTGHDLHHQKQVNEAIKSA
jgi:hypothetical protein